MWKKKKKKKQKEEKKVKKKTSQNRKEKSEEIQYLHKSSTFIEACTLNGGWHIKKIWF